MAKDPKVFQEYPYFLTLTVVGWTDFFIRQEYRQQIFENLQFCQENKGLEVYCYCLMTSHLHLIAIGRDLPINEIMRSLKSFSGKFLLRSMRENPQESRKPWLESRFKYLANIRAKDTETQFWERDNYPEAILTDAFFRQKQNYIHQNPVVAGFVTRPEDWYYSSACPEGPLKIVPFD